MCGRYLFTDEQVEEIRHIAQEIDKKYNAGTWKQGEIFPSAKAPVLLERNGNIQPELLTWGYQMPKSLIINARAETAGEKPMFRESVVAGRCVIPSTGFYEWDKQKRKYLFNLPGEGALYMAGLYSIRNGNTSYVILTTEANESMREVHHRMPLVLEKKQVAPWLMQPEATVEFLHMTPPILDRLATDTQLRLW